MLKKLKTLIPLMRKHKTAYIAGFLFLFLTDAAQIIIPQFIKKAVNILSISSPDRPQLARLMLIMVIVSVLAFAGRYGWRHFILGSSRRIAAELRSRLFSKLLLLSGDFYSEYKTGDIMARATNDISAIQRACGMALTALFDGLFMGTAILIVLITQYKILALFLIIPMPFITALILFFGSKIGFRFKGIQEGYSDLSSFIQESYSGIRVLKSFVHEKENMRQFTVLNKEYISRNLTMARMWGVFFPLISFLSGISTFILILAGGKAVINGTLTYGDLAALLSYLSMMTWPMISAGFTINVLQRGAVSMERIDEILNKEITVTSLPGASEAFAGDIEIKNLSYRYSEGTLALDNVNFLVPRGMTVGIMGKTGSGKSTLIRLLTRILDPPEDTVFLDGQDIRTIKLPGLRSLFGMVPQESFLFSESLRDNIRFARPEASEEEVIHAAAVSTINRDVNLFSESWNTMVGEKGVTLSGGQKQRTAISRALLTKPEVLILDDSLSNVDTQTEEQILQHLPKDRKNGTNIIVSHRVSAVQKADYIIVLDQGKLVQKGSHSDLINQEGYYKNIYEKQQMEEKHG